MLRPIVSASMLLLLGCAAPVPSRALGPLEWLAAHAPAPQATGTLERFQPMPSRHVAVRRIDVWPPPSYAREPTRP